MRRIGDERGAVAVEFGLISIVLFLLVFGIIEFGRTYSEFQSLQAAAREGARLAAVRADAGAVTARVYDAADPYTPTGAPAVDKQCGPETVGQPVTVSWTQQFDIDIAFMPSVSVSRQIRGVFRCE